MYLSPAIACCHGGAAKISAVGAARGPHVDLFSSAAAGTLSIRELNLNIIYSITKLVLIFMSLNFLSAIRHQARRSASLAKCLVFADFTTLRCIFPIINNTWCNIV